MPIILIAKRTAVTGLIAIVNISDRKLLLTKYNRYRIL